MLKNPLKPNSFLKKPPETQTSFSYRQKLRKLRPILET